MNENFESPKRKNHFIDISVPSKKKNSGSFDRFIPSQINSNLFNLSILKEKKDNNYKKKQKLDHININDDLRKDQNLSNYANLLEKEIFYSENENNRKLFSYKKYHKSKSDVMLGYSSNLFENDNENQNISHSYIRKIPKQPYKILDAPKLQDDFYLNLLDWSIDNVISIALENIVYTWSAQTCQAFKIYEASPGEPVTNVSFSKEKSNLLSIGENSGEMKIFDIHKNKIVRAYQNHDNRISVSAWNGSLIATGSRDRRIQISDIRDKKDIEYSYYGHKQEVCGLKWSYDDNTLASGGNDNKIYLWSLSNSSKKASNHLARFDDHTAAVKALSWSPFHRGLLFSGGGTTDKKIRCWNTMTGSNSLVKCIDTGSQVSNIYCSQSVNEILTTHGYSLNHICIYKYPSFQKIASLSGHTSRVLYLAISPNEENIVTGAGDETLRYLKIKYI